MTADRAEPTQSIDSDDQEPTEESSENAHGADDERPGGEHPTGERQAEENRRNEPPA